jgi:GNAT superfamily N-acetyltransferase
MAGLAARIATAQDIPALEAVMAAAIGELQKGFLSPAQIESSRMVMGLDRQLIADGTYLIIESEGRIAGCGGWSRRATLYGGDHTPGRDTALLDPARDPARVRAMYTHPDFARRGVGQMILSLCEAAAVAEGFSRLELMGTLSGEPLYLRAGFVPIERIEDSRGGAPVPLVRMGKVIGA